MTAVLDRSAPEVTPTPPPEATRRRRPLWWSKWALSGLLATTAVLYLWNLSASGFANTFYAAAAQAGSQSWRASPPTG